MLSLDCVAAMHAQYCAVRHAVRAIRHAKQFERALGKAAPGQTAVLGGERTVVLHSERMRGGRFVPHTLARSGWLFFPRGRLEAGELERGRFALHV
jgi:hypothetical protein